MTDSTPRITAEPAWRPGRLRTWFLRHYARDPEFQERLEVLYQEHCAGRENELSQLGDLASVRSAETPASTGLPGAYLEAIASLARDFGLHRLQPDHRRGARRSHSLGEQLIHRWCHWKARLKQRGVVVSAKSFATLGDHYRSAAIDKLLVVHVEREWPLDIRSRADIGREMRDELERLVDEELDRIEGEAKAAGHELPGPSKAQRDVEWVFLKTRWGMTFGGIADAAYRSSGVDIREESVRTAVRKMADQLGIDRSGRW